MRVKKYFSEWKDVCLEGREGDDNECSTLLLALIQKYVEYYSKIEINEQFIKDFEGVFEAIIRYLLSQYLYVIVTYNVESFIDEVYEKVEPVKEFISSLNNQIKAANIYLSEIEGDESKHSTPKRSLSKLSVSFSSPIHTTGNNTSNENQTKTISPK